MAVITRYGLGLYGVGLYSPVRITWSPNAISPTSIWMDVYQHGNKATWLNQGSVIWKSDPTASVWTEV